MTTSPTRRWAPWALTVVFVLLLAGIVVTQGPWVGGGAPPALFADPDPDPLRAPCPAGAARPELVVVSSTEKADLLDGLAREYNGLPDACATVTVDREASGDAAVRLRDEGVAGERRTPPDVWSPASSVWTAIASAPGPLGPSRVAGRMPATGPSVARTPLVLAVPRPTARALGWPERPLGWDDLTDLGRTLPSFPLGKTNPLVSTSGLYALLGGIAATPGVPGLYAGKAQDPRVRAFIAEIENRVVHYGNTELEFLENLAAARTDGRPYVSAVAVEEKAVWDHNHGNPEGDPSREGSLRPEAEQLVAFTPARGTFYADSPFLVLNEQKRAAADDFRRWLRTDDQQDDFRRHGFRDVRGVAGPGLDLAGGFPGPAPAPLPPPDPAVVAEALALWPQVRRPATVTVVVDRSGSMGDPIAGDPRPRIDAVRSALIRELGKLNGDRDALGLWTFSSAPPGRVEPWTVDVPVGLYRDVAGDVGATLNGVPLGGQTALWRTVRDVVERRRGEALDPTRINAVVVLTDGLDTEGGGAAAVEETVRAVGATNGAPVRVFPVAYSPDAERGLADLTRVARASGGYAYDATEPGSIERVVADLVSNF